MTKKNILIIEDEKAIVNFIKNRLDPNEYNVDIAYDGKIALTKLNLKNYDLITLDIMLPFIDGFEICKAIRNKSKKTLIIMISALDIEEFKVKGYEFGIDDYISKPFSAKELSYKIKAIFRRRGELLNLQVNNTSGLTIKDEEREIQIDSKVLDLTPSEYLILSVLIKNKNRVYSRQELAQIIYDHYLGAIDDRNIDSHIYHIRKKVKAYKDKNIIKTVRGIGYKINET